jgi:hypothetical protein
MSNEHESLVLKHLGIIRDQLSHIRLRVDQLHEDMQDLKTRTGLVEQAVVNVVRRLDRYEDRFVRIENRLTLSDMPGTA